jgi:hypothetical protein
MVVEHCERPERAPVSVVPRRTIGRAIARTLSAMVPECELRKTAAFVRERDASSGPA